MARHSTHPARSSSALFLIPQGCGVSPQRETFAGDLGESGLIYALYYKDDLRLDSYASVPLNSLTLLSYRNGETRL